MAAVQIDGAELLVDKRIDRQTYNIFINLHSLLKCRYSLFVRIFLDCLLLHIFFVSAFLQPIYKVYEF